MSRVFNPLVKKGFDETTPSGSGVDSVNGFSGVVVLDPDDLDDASTSHKFVSSSDLSDLAANTSARHDAVTFAGTGTYISLSGQEITVDPITESDITDLQSYITDITGENLSDLSDVTITSIASGEVLKWNGSAWVNNTLSEAGIAAASHTHTASEITDFDTEVANNTAVAANTAKNSYPSADSTKLAGIEAGATADQTGAEIKAAYEGEADTNAFTDADHTKLDGIETGAEVNPTDAEIKTAYENNSNTNAYTDAEQTKVGYLTVTQAVDLDQMETDIAALANGMVYKGDWDASAGTFPGSGSAQTGWFYYVSVAGTVDSIAFAVGDNIVATTDDASTSTYASNWSKHDQTDAVQSVAGKTGAVTLVEADITDLGTYLEDITGESLSSLSDVTITSIAANELLQWSGSAWVNQTLAEAGVAAASHTHTESDITDLGDYLLKSGGTMTGNIDMSSSDIVDAGNVVIGADSGDVELHVKPAGTNVPSLYSGTVAILQRNSSTLNQVYMSLIAGNASTSGGINFGDAERENSGYIHYDHADEEMRIGADGATAMTIDDSQRVTFANDIFLQGMLDRTEGSNVNTNLDIEFPDVSTATARIRLFRTTNTSGIKDLIIYKGDGTTASQTSLAADDHSYINANAGNVHIGGTSDATEKLEVTGNIALSGTVDGRDIAADGTKLDGIESNATADQSDAEIKTAYENNADTNAFTDAEQTKLSGIETSADVTDTANVTAAGALMDSEVTNLADVKSFDPADYAAASHTHTESDITDLGDYLLKSGGTMSGDINMATNNITDVGTIEIEDDGVIDFESTGAGTIYFGNKTDTGQYGNYYFKGSLNGDYGIRIYPRDEAGSITNFGHFGYDHSNTYVQIGTAGNLADLRVYEDGDVRVQRGALEIGATGENANSKILFYKTAAATNSYLPAIQQGSVIDAGVGNDLIMGATSGDGGIVFYTGTASASGSLGTGSNASRMTIDKDGVVNIVGNLTIGGTVDGVDIAARDHDAVTLAGTGTYISLSGQEITVDPITESDITDLQSYLTDITGENLSSLSDVTITSIASGELLKWNGSAWINNTLAEAGIAAASHTHVEADITDLGDYLEKTGGTLTGALTVDNDTNALFGITVVNEHTGDTAAAGITMTSNGGTSYMYRTGTNYGGGYDDVTIIQDAGGGDIIIYGAAEVAKFNNGGGVDITGNIAVTGTVDGRDVATDGTKLDGVETGAQATKLPTGGTAGQVLEKIDGTNYNVQWATPSGGGGGVSGPGSSTDNELPRFNGTGGDTLQGSGITISDLVSNEYTLDTVDESLILNLGDGHLNIEAYDGVNINDDGTGNGLSVNRIHEYTSAAGVTIDGVLIKDGELDGVDMANVFHTTTSDVSSYSAVLDEDDLNSDSATQLATQQSIKAYVDAKGLMGTWSWGRIYCYTDNRWVTGNDDNYGITYHQHNESGGTGASPIVEWEHRGWYMPDNIKIKNIYIFGRVNNVEVTDLELDIYACTPTTAGRWEGAGVDNDGELTNTQLHNDNFFSPTGGGTAFTGATNDNHVRKITIDHSLTAGSELRIYMKPAGTITATRYFPHGIFVEWEREA